MLNKTDLLQIGNVVDEKLKPIKKDLKKVRKDLEFVAGTLDRERWQLEKRFDSHTAHPPVSA